MSSADIQTLPRPILTARSTNAVMRTTVSMLMACLVLLCTLVAVGVMLSILVYVAVQGWPALNIDFFTQRPLPFGEVGGGVAPALHGTLLMLLVASIVGVPIGIGTAICLAEFGQSPLAASVGFIVDLLLGFPSIVIGVFAWALIVRHVVGNFAGIAGSAALAIIIIPIVARTVEEILRLIPGHLREASLALGVPKWRTILFVVLPAARNGIVAGAVMAIARAGGETAPLLLTALGNQFFNYDLLKPMASLPVQIYNYAASPYDDWHTKAWGAALLLITVIGTLNLSFRLIARKEIV